MAENIFERMIAYIQKDPPPSEVTATDTRLFDEAELVLPDYLKGERWEQRLLLMRNLSGALMDLRRTDHAQIVSLLIRLFNDFSWQQICDFGTGSIPYKDGLGVGEGMEPFNKLMICLLSKATTNSSDAAHAASMLDTMQALLRLWLTTPNTGVATQAGELLYGLLKVDVPPTAALTYSEMETQLHTPGGNGLVWKRIFGDRDVYRVFFESCSLTAGAPNLSKNRKTIAQARLMEWLPQVGALNWAAVARSHHEDLERKYGVKAGLLDFAAMHMVDYEEDVLMHRCLIDFFADLLVKTAKLDTYMMRQSDSVGLQFLLTNKLHERTIAIYLQQGERDPLEATFLYGSAANYIATYASEYQHHYITSTTAKDITQRLRHVFDLTESQWMRAEPPSHDLHLIASLPRLALLPFTSSPLALLPTKGANPETLAEIYRTLATIFHGPLKHAAPTTESHPASQPLSATILRDPTTDSTGEEAAAARALYYQYLALNPHLWHNICLDANVLAFKGRALSAISLITAITTANWSITGSTATNQNLPTSTLATPESGHLAILAPPALEYVLPYLLAPPVLFENVGQDVESTAYQVAMAKFDALRALNSKLMGEVERRPGEGFEEILARLGRRLAEGPFGRRGESGAQVETMGL